MLEDNGRVQQNDGYSDSVPAKMSRDFKLNLPLGMLFLFQSVI